MKKLLISLTILFSLFICVNSVSAYTTATYHSTSDDWVYINTLNMTQEEISVYSEKYVSYDTSATETAIKRILAARDYYNTYYSDKYSYYIITANMAQSSPWIYLFVFNEFPYSSYYLEAPYVVNGTGYLNYNSIHFRFDNSDTSLYKLFYTSNGTKFSERPSYENNVLILNNSSSSSLKYLSNYYETNYSFDVRLNPDKGTGTAYYDVFYYDDKVYQNGDILFNTLEKNNMNIVKENKPTLKYKTGFVSSEAYNVLGKVSVEFSETDTNIYKYKKSQFKLQFGSNDFSKEYIPVFSHYKVFGKRSGTWTELSEEQLKFPYGEDENGNVIYDDRRLVTIDTTYDYSEGMLADASITFEINYSNLVDTSTTDPIYTDWKIEFYFDNTDNSYIYVYDTLDSSTWTDTAKFLEDYIYYYFPSNYKYAFIVNETENNCKGRIYFPTNFIKNDLVKLQGQYYSLNEKKFGKPIITSIYENDNFYSYFDFNFNDDNYILSLNRILGGKNYSNYYNQDTITGILEAFLMMWDKNIAITSTFYNTENAYFYVPIGYKVYFTNNSNINVITSNGSITIDIDNSKNEYESRVDEDVPTLDNDDSFFRLFHKAFEFFIAPIKSIFSVITQVFVVLPIGIQYMFYVSFGFIILLLIYKFLL